MQRVAFFMHVKEGQEEEYIRRHRDVWPQVLTDLEKAGVGQMNIFMADRQLFLYMEADDYAEAAHILGALGGIHGTNHGRRQRRDLRFQKSLSCKPVRSLLLAQRRMKMTALAGQVALITGAGSGMGRATAALFAKEGAKVVVIDIDEAGGEETLAQIRAAGGEALFARADVANAADAEAMIQRAIDTYGRLDILHNNAGVVSVKFLEDMSEEEWDWLMGVNLKSIFLAIKYAVPHMKAQGGGRILNTGSTGSFIGQYMTPAYIASKGGVIQLTKSLALDYAQYKIRVNAICPGTVDTPLVRQHIENSPDPARAETIEKQLIPLKRFLQPEEIAHAALYLASNQADGVTGSALVIDGGTLAGYVD